jgi:hypothetical protein
MIIIPVITIKKCIQNRILKCGSDPNKQERRRGGKGNDVNNADLMYKPPPCEERNLSIEEQTNKKKRETLKPSLEVLVNEYSDGFKALAQHEEEFVAVTQLENSTKTSQKKQIKPHPHCFQPVLLMPK